MSQFSFCKIKKKKIKKLFQKKTKKKQPVKTFLGSHISPTFQPPTKLESKTNPLHSDPLSNNNLSSSSSHLSQIVEPFSIRNHTHNMKEQIFCFLSGDCRQQDDRRREDLLCFGQCKIHRVDRCFWC